MESTCDETLVVSIDFGTSSSGYAFSLKTEYNENPGKISAIENKSNVGAKGSVQPTAVLIKMNDKLDKPEYHAFGYDAQDKYTELVEEDEDKDFFLLNNFKMKLYSDSATSDLSNETTIDIGNNYRINGVELFGKYIEFLKNHFWKSISPRGYGLKENDIRWVLTVPAIWNDGAKQFMREAAVKAGISSSKLTIAYEPEAAALCCLHLRDHTKSDILETGEKCVVIDAGGGTVDYTVFEVTEANQIDIKSGASGGPWGETTINEKFLGMFQDIFGEEVFASFEKNNRGDFMELCKDFEIKKRHFSENTGKLNFKIPPSLSKAYIDITGKSLQFIMYGKYSNSVKVIGEKLRVDACVFRQFFLDSCYMFVDHAMKLLRKEECKGIDTLLLVGGFFGSEILQQTMKKKFPKYNHIIPEDPESAVLKGAVLFGHNPKSVQTRVARFTYGVDSYKPFDPIAHPMDKKEIIDGKACCKDIFDRTSLISMCDKQSRSMKKDQDGNM